jgi:hypothetical protein
MIDALISTRTSNYLGSINQWSISLDGTPIDLQDIDSLILKSGDITSTLTTRDGTTRPIYAKRTFWRNRLLLDGELTVRPPGMDTPVKLDVRDVTYMMLKNI